MNTMDAEKLFILNHIKNMVDAKTLCEKLNIAQSTLWYYRKTGLPYYKIGGRVYFNLDETAEYLIKKNPRKLLNYDRKQ
ncbi:MAG: helix-turn-helix domain-containing protein [Candidatus Delongbacteria bacterium]|nr:helix-turn-helix domain-containing protein [Candidatus Delongbacteria bacterium]